MDRVIGDFISEERGPLIIFVGGIHGNEHAGVKAINHVFDILRKEKIPFTGRVVGLKGNLKALKENIRYYDYDMNRCWTEEFITEVKNSEIEKEGNLEGYEAVALLEEIEKVNQGDYTQKILVDLHTTSSDNGNFIVIPEGEANNHIVKVLKLPIVIDLDKYLEGTLLEFMHHRGYLGFAFEGGLIGTQKALNLHISGIWELLYAADSVKHQHSQKFSNYDNITKHFTKGLPNLVSVLYRHWVNEDDAFKMMPGYHNFQRIKSGELLAHDKNGSIEAKCNGLIFMPLYQDSGNDGFFVVQEVN